MNTVLGVGFELENDCKLVMVATTGKDGVHFTDVDGTITIIAQKTVRSLRPLKDEKLIGVSMELVKGIMEFIWSMQDKELMCKVRQVVLNDCEKRGVSRERISNAFSKLIELAECNNLAEILLKDINDALKECRT